MRRLSAMLSLLAAMAMTGANVPLAKLLLQEMPPAILLALRFALAVLVLVPLARLEAGPTLTQLGRRQWRTVALLGVVGSVMFTWFVLEGVRRTSGVSAGIILSSLPAVVATAALLRGDRLRAGEIAMIALAVAGVALIQAHPDGAGESGAAPSPFLGNLLVAGAVVCEAAFVIGARRISTEVGPLRLSLAVALVGLVVSIPPAVPAMSQVDLAWLNTGTLALLAWYALTSSVLCTILWYRGVGHVEAWAAGLATAAVPVSAMAVSVLALGETLSPAQLLGAGLVVAAIVAGTSRPRR